MDLRSLAVLIPLFALAIPIAGIIFHGLQKMAQLRVEEARIRAGGLDGATASDVSALREEMGEVRRELAEVQERLDFAERLLTRGREVE
jgi:hypothetical protein